MEIIYRRMCFRLGDLLGCFVILLIASCFSFIIVMELKTKDDVVINDNYKGTKILVKHYKPFNKDSVYLAYSKPKTYKLKINGIINSRELMATVDGKEQRRIKVAFNAHHLKVGQTIKVTREFYPNDITKTENGDKVVWR